MISQDHLKKVKSTVSVNINEIGNGAPVYFIAEIGNNHNGDFYLAKKTIEAAAAAGADAVKFQKRFVTETFTKDLRDKPQIKDQVLGSTYGEYRESLELNEEEFHKLKQYSEELGVTFFATPFDLKSVDFLENVGQDVYKIASFDVTNIPLLEKIAKLGKPIILSTGMSNLEEVDEAVETILKHNNQLVILYCISIYPTPDEYINVNVFKDLQDRYAPIPIGYSGHEKDILASLTFVGLGAKCIERHFTLDKKLPGPDHATVSIEPAEFKQMVDQARRIEKMMVEGSKYIHQDEQKTRDKHGKSLTSRIDIPLGTVITADMICTRSPGIGLKPNRLDEVLGKKALFNIAADTTLTGKEIEGIQT